MSEEHRLHAVRHLTADTKATKPPKNPQSYIEASTTDVLDDPRWGKPDEQPPTMAALEKALLNGNLHPADAQKVCTYLSMGRPMPRDLLDRVAAALTTKASGKSA